MRTLIAFAVLLIASGAGRASAAVPLVLCFGSDIAPRVRTLITHHIQAVDAEAKTCEAKQDESQAQNVLVFGASGNDERPDTDIALTSTRKSNTTYYFALGAASARRPNLNAHFAAYALLERLGFRFLHPLQPEVPKALVFPDSIDQHENARWPVRRWHLHTQHPLELTNLLNGWGKDASEDQAGFDEMLPEWEAFLEWCLANKQNQVSWYLLMAKPWQDFADSALRQARLGALHRIAHEFGIETGITAPLAFQQQHAWTMIRRTGQEVDQIHHAIDWLAATGLDFIEIEMGFSEFTHPDDRTMLAWMNEATRYAKDNYRISTSVKVHASTGQVADDFQNPVTGEKLNFNFLPYYADPELAVMPHTVQVYGLQDPAPTYGNQDFSAIYEYLRWEAGRRPVLFYPETAYWVSYDNDVPLFLPIYGERRLADLRLIAKAEDAGELGLGAQKGSRIQGQVNFSSGWEWGYWLNDVLAARAAWNPYLDVKDDGLALRLSLEPVSSLFGPAKDEFESLLSELIQFENDTLIRGKFAGITPSTPVKRSGQAYLQGVDAWDDLGDLFNVASTQPDKLGLLTVRSPLGALASPSYQREIAPLLFYMKERFAEFSLRLKDLESRVPNQARPIYEEFQDSLDITSLRAEQVYALYQFAAHANNLEAAVDEQNRWQNEAEDALRRGLAISVRRSASYRVPLDRIAAWKAGPTAYNYGYLWTVSNLFYWRRDAGKAIEAMRSPCYLNTVDPIDVTFGYSLDTLSAWTDCLHKPEVEPKF